MKYLLFLIFFIKIIRATNLIFFYVDDLNVILSPVSDDPFLKRMSQISYNFKYGHASSPLCLPSRSATLFGIPSYKSNILDNEQSYINNYPHHTSLPELLQNNKYQVGIYGKVFHPKEQEKIEHKFKYIHTPIKKQPPYIGFYSKFSLGGLNYGNISNGSTFDEVSYNKSFEFLNSINKKLPFAFFFGIKNPHLPFYFRNYNIGDIVRYYEQVKDYPLNLDPKLIYEIKFNFIKNINKTFEFINSYYRTAKTGLVLLENMYNELEKRDLLNNSIIVFVSDNGFELMSNSHFGKANQNPLSIRTTIMISKPNRIKRTCKAWSSSVNVYYTLLRLMKIKYNIVQNISKINLMKCEKVESISSSRYENTIDHSLLIDKYQYRNGTLYLRNDIYKKKKIYNDTLINKFRKKLFEIIN
jgi:hypothetical protein